MSKKVKKRRMSIDLEEEDYEFISQAAEEHNISTKEVSETLLTAVVKNRKIERERRKKKFNLLTTVKKILKL
jgi:hypothetical protein